MILERALVDHLFVRGDIDRKHVAARALGDHAAVVLVADEFSAEVDLHAEARGITSDDRGVEMKRHRRGTPLLHGDVVQLGAFFDHEIVDPAGEGRGAVGTAEAIDHRGPAVTFADHEGVRENSGVLAFDPVENFNRLRDFEIFGDADKHAVDRAGAVQGGIFGRSEFGFLRHEMFLHEIGMLRGGLLEGHDDQTCRDQIRSGRGGGEKTVVPENKACGGFAQSRRARRQRGRISHGTRITKSIERKRPDIGETPFFVLRGRGGKLLKIFPPALARGDKPFGPVAFDQSAFDQRDAGNGCGCHIHVRSWRPLSRPTLPSRDR